MKETPKSLAAFEQYYALGEERSLAALAEHLHQKQSKPIPSQATILSQLKKWSSAHEWQARVVQRDKEVFAKLQRKREKAIADMNERQALIGVTQQKAAIEQISALIAGQAFGSMAAVQLLKLALDIERVARGVPAETASMEVTGKDGAPIETIGRVAVYLPQKNPPPSVSSEEETGE